jgi:hypothetical protein
LSFVSVASERDEAPGDVGSDPDLTAFFWLAFWAASAPACRMAIVRGVSSLFGVLALVFRWPSAGSSICICSDLVEGAEVALGDVLREEGTFEGVVVVEVAGVALTAGVAPMCCFNSPYSFHSSISSRSYNFQFSMAVS